MFVSHRDHRGISQQSTVHLTTGMISLIQRIADDCKYALEAIKERQPLPMIVESLNADVETKKAMIEVEVWQDIVEEKMIWDWAVVVPDPVLMIWGLRRSSIAVL